MILHIRIPIYLAISIRSLRRTIRRILPGTPGITQRGKRPAFTLCAYPEGDPFNLCRIADFYEDIRDRKMIITVLIRKILDRAYIYPDTPADMLPKLTCLNQANLSECRFIHRLTSAAYAASDIRRDIHDAIAKVVPEDSFSIL